MSSDRAIVVAHASDMAHASRDGDGELHEAVDARAATGWESNGDDNTAGPTELADADSACSDKDVQLTDQADGNSVKDGQAEIEVTSECRASRDSTDEEKNNFRLETKWDWDCLVEDVRSCKGRVLNLRRAANLRNLNKPLEVNFVEALVILYH